MPPVPGFFLLLALALPWLFSCTQGKKEAAPAEEPVPLYLSTGLSSPNPKGRWMLRAAELFVETQAKDKLKILSADSGQDNRLSAEQVLEFARKPDPKLVFGPPGSGPSALLVEKAKLAPLPPRTFLLNQVTASAVMHEALPSLGTFFPAREYLSGFVPLLLKEGGRPRQIFLLVRGGIPYFREIAEGVKTELAAHLLSIKAELELPETPDARLLRRWKGFGAGAGDWIILLDYGDPATISALAEDKGFAAATKLAAYGSLPEPGKAPWYYRNSWQALFWHPYFRYHGSGAVDNCGFVKAYAAAYGEEPEFHGAFIYATLEAAKGLGYTSPYLSGGAQAAAPQPTILGTFRWNKLGQPAGRKPIFARLNQAGTLEIVLPPEIEGPCEQAKAPLKGAVLRR
jgi:hypothetical protein